MVICFNQKFSTGQVKYIFIISTCNKEAKIESAQAVNTHNYEQYDESPKQDVKPVYFQICFTLLFPMSIYLFNSIFHYQIRQKKQKEYDFHENVQHGI
jgi:hypothetical protein